LEVPKQGKGCGVKKRFRRIREASPNSRGYYTILFKDAQQFISMSIGNINLARLTRLVGKTQINKGGFENLHDFDLRKR